MSSSVMSSPLMSVTVTFAVRCRKSSRVSPNFTIPEASIKSLAFRSSSELWSAKTSTSGLREMSAALIGHHASTSVSRLFQKNGLSQPSITVPPLTVTLYSRTSSPTLTATDEMPSQPPLTALPVAVRSFPAVKLMGLPSSTRFPSLSFVQETADAARQRAATYIRIIQVLIVLSQR